MAKIKCLECGRQMHPYHMDASGRAEFVRYGKKQNLKRYICPYGHSRYVEVKK